MIGLIGALVVAGAAGEQASGAIIYQGSTRIVSAQIGSSSQTRMAPDQEPWSDTASASFGPAQATLSSSQTSSLTETGIMAIGTLSYSRLMQDLTTGVASGSVSVFFVLDEPTAYTLVADVASGDTGSVSLISAFGTIHSGNRLNVSGVLDPGAYQLSSSITLNAPQLGPGSVSWNVRFTVPGPGTAGTFAAAGLAMARRRSRPKKM